MNQEERWLLEEKYNGVETAEFLADRERLAGGEPLGYLIGSIPFLDCTIYLDSHPLIPRPETEYWTEKAIDKIKTTFPRTDLGKIKVLDLCAGSGCVGVAVAKAIPEAAVDFAEIDTRHLPTIRKNIEKNLMGNTIIYDSGNADKYNVWQSDLFSGLPTPDKSDVGRVVLSEFRGAETEANETYRAYDQETSAHRDKEIRPNDTTYNFILSNPPYIDPVLDRTEKSVKEHEPHHALYGGQAGMEFIEHIIATAKQFLTKEGQLWLEHEPEQVEAIKTLAEQHGFTTQTHNDQYNIARFSVLTVAQ